MVEGSDALAISPEASSETAAVSLTELIELGDLLVDCGATTVGIAGATWSGCSGAATASVGKVLVRNGPLGTSAENWQAFVQRAPDKFLGNVIVVVPIEIADPHDGAPWQFGMASMQFRGEPPSHF